MPSPRKGSPWTCAANPEISVVLPFDGGKRMRVAVPESGESSYIVAGTRVDGIGRDWRRGGKCNRRAVEIPCGRFRCSVVQTNRPFVDHSEGEGRRPQEVSMSYAGDLHWLLRLNLMAISRRAWFGPSDTAFQRRFRFATRRSECQFSGQINHSGPRCAGHQTECRTAQRRVRV